MIDVSDERITLDNPKYLAGFTGIGIVVLAAVAYSIQISVDRSSGSSLLTATFLLANLAGWLIGSMLRSRSPHSMLGLHLVLLGDALFPLNLFAPLILFAPWLRGSVPLCVTFVLIVGIGYHLWNYRRRSRVRFALPFYPYYFALAGGAILVLTQFTAGLPPGAVAWLTLVYAVAFNEASHRMRPEPSQHFAYAAATILTGSLVVSALAFRDRGAAALAALIAGTIVLIASAIRESRSDEAIGRAHALAAWLGITFSFTALLYLAHCPLWVYVAATGAWTILLVIVSTLPARGWSEPFIESAWWTAVLLTMALAVALWKVWMPFIVRTMASRPFGGVTSIGLLETGLALLAVSAWRRRYPPIASTMGGFVANNFLLRLTSYAAPLLLIVALAGGWSVLHAPAPANVYALLAAGVLLLIFGPLLGRRYPAEALDFAGVLAMVFSAFNAVASAMLSACVLFAAALIFLVRFVRGATIWTFAAFLVLTIAGLLLQPFGTLPATAILLAAAAVIAWGSSRAAGVMARIGYWIAHGAAFAFWLSLARQLGYGRGYDALILASWAWFAFAASRMAPGKASRTSIHVCLVLVAASLVCMMAEPAGTRVLLAALLLASALLLEVEHFHYAGFALLAVAVVLAVNRGDGRTLAAVLGGCAVILLWRSLIKGSTFGHLSFVAAAAACAYLLMPAHGSMRALPLAVLVATFLVVELLAMKVQTSSRFHGDITSVVALVLAATVLAVEIASTRFSIYVLALLLLAVLAIRPWIGRSKRHRVQPAAHAAFRAIGITTGAAVVVAAARLAGLTAGQQIFALACTAWIVLAWLLRSRRGTADSLATAVALHVIGIGVYAAAYAVRSGDAWSLFACIAIAGAYLTWGAAWRLPVLEHFAGAGAVEAVCLFGVARNVAWPEYYLFAAAAYLCIVLLRETAPPRYRNSLAVAAIAAAVAYPLYALLRVPLEEHLAYLALASVVVIHTLLVSRRHVLMVFAVCAMLGVGMLFGAAVLPGDARLNLLMALVGFLVIADLGVIGLHSDRRLLLGDEL
jgi:hypothetical protein